MTEYIERIEPLIVDAVVWTPEKGHSHVVLQANSDTIGVIMNTSGHELVFPGDFIVTYSDGQVHRMAPDLFASRFVKSSNKTTIPPKLLASEGDK